MSLPLITRKVSRFEEAARVIERATRSQDHRLIDVLKFDSKLTAITQSPAN